MIALASTMPSKHVTDIWEDQAEASGCSFFYFLRGRLRSTALADVSQEAKSAKTAAQWRLFEEHVSSELQNLYIFSSQLACIDDGIGLAGAQR